MARQWLQSKGPKGGTRLRDGVNRALGIKFKRTFKVEKLQVDTVIVLCDGATEEGSRWVDPVWLELVHGEGLAMFFDPDIESEIRCLDAFRADGAAKHPPIRYGSYFAMRLDANFPDRV